MHPKVEETREEEKKERKIENNNEIHHTCKETLKT
jgi:hypothetical protein